MHGHMNIKLRL